MKKAVDDIFLLVKSMTKSEKRYSQLWLSRALSKEGNHFLWLYEAIETQEQYDEEELIQGLKKRGGDYFPVLKRQLYEKLLTALGDFNLGKDYKEQVKRKLQGISILIRKGLYGQAEKLLKQTAKKIEKYELLECWPEWESIQLQLLSRKMYKGVSVEAYKKEIERFKEREKNLGEWLEMRQEAGLIGIFHYQKNTKPTESESQELAAILSKPSFENPKTCLTQIIALQTASRFNFMRGNAELAFEKNQKMLALFESTDWLMKRFPESYVSNLNNYLIDTHILKKEKALEEGLLKWRSLPSQSIFRRIQNLELQVFEFGATLELNRIVMAASFSTSKEIVQEIIPQFEGLKKKMSSHQRVTLEYLIAYISLMNKDFEIAQNYLIRILQFPEKTVMKQLYFASQILELLLHFDLDNDRLMESLLNSLRRQIRSQRALNKLEESLFDFLKNSLQSSSERARKELQTHFGESLGQMSFTDQEKQLLNFVNLPWWAKEKR